VVELNSGERRVLNAPLNLWSLVLNRVDRCRKRSSDSPRMLYYFVKKKCDSFNVSVHESKEPLEREEETEMQGRKRNGSNCEESESSLKRTKKYSQRWSRRVTFVAFSCMLLLERYIAVVISMLYLVNCLYLGGARMHRAGSY
jgi:hypothetical protein